MGWLSWGSSDDSGPKKTSGGAFEAPTRTTRAKCYESRDAFFECLDRNNILDSIHTKGGRAASAKLCGDLDKDFEKNCAHSWVEYFKKQRVVNYQKEQTIKKLEAEGADVVAPQLPTRN
ncbi:cytochrome oxidase c subunit VIb-domain-containing protein [Massariosphaeria phaeospora]|uniref:Cytochrome oxidase c subunit VIb-domain-containing protein n=1 Tax=Massariosphaeria phaeospora TaxID=100035 RepID=A0A7C8M1F3_9PLEO|nr:cytochrome oxidase c subunit VIb-domain-containing protein [Massariosphaeria phaeospora]